ncbi:hypothetical protein LOK49_LG05G02504 [Camellia lanceoleosa]|uniref:Uncharacterized protein n=1 Tax=Camellia lanceoleosa TaxID=1840588 RepID=A0ACC0HSZ9_9ERIC|nr:hypothetical protein LOK49_LG05G02504 [Camellia lanceoleosa]
MDDKKTMSKVKRKKVKAIFELTWGRKLQGTTFPLPQGYSEISAELQRERQKNAELIERTSILEAQIQKRDMDKYGRGGTENGGSLLREGSCKAPLFLFPKAITGNYPSAKERSFKKFKSQKAEFSGQKIEDGNNKTFQTRHDTRCVPPRETNLENFIVNWMSMDDNKTMSKVKRKKVKAIFEVTPFAMLSHVATGIRGSTLVRAKILISFFFPFWILELRRLVAYAKSGANLLAKLILQDQHDSYRWKCLFRTPLNNYNAVVLLHRDRLPYPHCLLFPSELNQGKHVVRENERKLRGTKT